MNVQLYFIFIYGLGICSQVFATRVRRLVGGEDAEPEKFPYIVSLRTFRDKTHFCGGSIIHQKFILTAAHCLEWMSPKDFYIIAGTILLTTEAKPYYVDKFSYHFHYDSDKIINDIGLIKLKKGLKFSKFIQKVPVYNSVVPAGTSATVSGWGNLKFLFFDYRPSIYLQSLNVTTISLKKCRYEYKRDGIDRHKHINKRHICTRTKNYKNNLDIYNAPRVGFCNGDSGGPLVHNGKLVGIVSWSRNCAIYPDVYVKVSAYTQWIEFTMKKLNRL